MKERERQNKPSTIEYFDSQWHLKLPSSVEITQPIEDIPAEARPLILEPAVAAAKGRLPGAPNKRKREDDPGTFVIRTYGAEGSYRPWSEWKKCGYCRQATVPAHNARSCPKKKVDIAAAFNCPKLV
ncbi:uncharacterized protein DFL_009229 [Arthrobotrys flagrans]|uniref:Uncharacterized protein n=1 Tax=Arthrobotrys flagrans TaxID=97331 RepID=A0A436ZRC8_ARTFL|nr:hypothetical protein DFL_009229 [Arthrobotrys flagrans]